MASLKVALTLVLTATPVAPADGTVEVTVGATVSPTAAVVKLQTLAVARAWPVRSMAPVVIVPTQVVPAARPPVGVNRATLVVAS